MRRDDDTQVRLPTDSAAEEHVDDIPYIVVLSGRCVGRMFRVTGERMFVGRGVECEFLLDDTGVSRKHAVIEMQDGKPWLRDCGSTNGTWIGDDRVESRPIPLQDGDRIRLGPSTILKYGCKDTVERQFLAHLYHSATRDGLTGVYNKRFFLEQVEQELAYHYRHNAPLTLILLDVDYFKSVNDTFGHQYGDAVLKRLAALLDSGCRAEDILVRFGGDEFAVILRQTGAREGRALGARLREMVEEETFSHNGVDLRITISVGVVTRVGEQLEDVAQLVQDTDAMLYRAKEEGRNTVCSDPPGNGPVADERC